MSLAYAGLSIEIAATLAYENPKPVLTTPGNLGLAYRDVSFPAREDQVLIRGWFIPGVLPTGKLTADRTLIVVHGRAKNRADPQDGILDLSARFARRGFAVLAFDMRGMGESPPAPDSLGFFEQRDVLGAVDFLRSGPPPYPLLGRPRIVGGWGVSMGAISLILAAAREPAVRAVVADSTPADVLSLLEREIPRQGHVPASFTPGALLMAYLLYGIDYAAVRPVDAVGRLAPRPLFLIDGTADTYTGQSSLGLLTTSARRAAGAQVTSWLVPKATHAQDFRTAPVEYVRRVMSFFETALGPDLSSGGAT